MKQIFKLIFFGSVTLVVLVGLYGLGKRFFGGSSEQGEIKAQLPASRPLLSSQGEELDLPPIDRVFQLFATGPTKLPIVETVTYAATVPWLKGRPAWIADYATYFATSRHFIARSMNGKPDYFTQRVGEGSRFNVFRRDKRIHFYLLTDLSHCKMGFYYVDLDTGERVLMKTYRVSAGKGDQTPLGTYQLGSQVAIYTPGVKGLFRQQEVEMVRVFGTRWLPFAKEVSGAPAKGLGLQGAPWVEDVKTGKLIELRDGLGKLETDGCIRLASEDIEELFAILITKPTYVVVVKDLRDAKLPGMEVAAPSR